MPALTTDLATVRNELADPGFSRIPAAGVRALVGPAALADWTGFARSWDNLGPDNFMADGGRYRRRRFACFAVRGDTVVRKAHQPHYQSIDDNPLNGGVDRWFDPVTDVIADHPLTRALFRLGREAFDPTGAVPWHVEMHQFRIEASPTAVGKPTPEGLHRDGVDWVLVMLVGRENVSGGVTEIRGPDRRPLGEFVLAEPLDLVLLDDHRVWHGVTPLEPEDPARAARRDVLVVTFRTGPGHRG
jgi:hypothetical protein